MKVLKAIKIELQLVFFLSLTKPYHLFYQAMFQMPQSIQAFLSILKFWW